MNGKSDSRRHAQPATASTIQEVGDRFEDCWRPEQTLDDLAAYLPPAADPSHQQTLVELACRDLERRLQLGQPARAEQYLERFPALGQEAAAAVEVITTEFQQRRSREANLAPEEYARRFPQFAAQLAEHLQPEGPVVPGYQILGVLGRGGMGVVYQANHLGLKRVVALKMILAGTHAGEEDLARFRHEAEAVARLQHPHIVQIYDVGEHNHLPYFALEFVDGGSLDKKLQATPQPAQAAAALIETLARAMHYAHQRGVVHRDLKPANVLLTADGQPKITDFGLAKRLDVDRGQTRTGAIVGTSTYMAPEQAVGQSKAIGPAADVYALGTILYEMLTGRPPFKALTLFDTLKQVTGEEPVPPRRLQPKLSPDLETICLKCLHKDPRQRYASAEELARDLRRFLDGEPILARPVSRIERLGRWCRRNPLVAGLLTAVAASLLLGTAVAIWLAIAANAHAQRADQKATEAQTNEQQAKEEKQKADKELLRSEWLVYSGQTALAQHAWQDGDVPAAWHYLDACRKDSRGWEYDYLYSLFNKNQTTFRGHTGQVFSVAFSPDGKRMVSGGDSLAIVWDVATGQQVLALKGPADEVHDGVFWLAFSPDGKRIVSSGLSDGRVKLWDVATGQAILTMRVRGGGVRSVAFIPDGKRIISGSEDGTVQVWDAATGQEIRTFKDKEGFTSATFRADGKQLVCGSGKLVKVLDAAAGQQIQTLKGHDGEVRSVALSADGKRIVSSDFVTVKVWDATTGNEIHTFTGPHTLVSSVAIRPDGKLIAWGGQSMVIVAGIAQPERFPDWQFSRQQPKWFFSGTFESVAAGHILRGHQEGVTRVAFSPDGKRILSSSRDGTVKLWDTMPHLDTIPLQPRAHVESVAFSPDAKRIVSAGGVQGGSDQVKVWDVATGRELRTLKGHRDSVVSVAVSLDGKWIVSASHDGTIKVWEAATGREQLTLNENRFSPTVAISPDGKHIAGSTTWFKRSFVQVWDTATGKETLRIGDTGAWRLVFSPDGKRLAGGCADQTVKVWDAATGQEILNIRGHTGLVHFLGFRADGKQLVSGSSDGTIKVWDAATGQEILTCKGHIQSVTSVAFTPDGKRIVSGSADGTAKVWNLKTGHETLSLKGPRSARGDFNQDLHPIWVTVCPDGKRIVAIGGGAGPVLTVWDATSSPEH